MKIHSKMLMDSGVFDTLSFTFNGEDLVYKLVPSPTLFPVRLENLPLTPGKELDAKLHDRFPLYHGKVSSAGTLLESVRGALEEMLANQGINAAVTATPFGTPGTKNVTAMNFPSIPTRPCGTHPTGWRLRGDAAHCQACRRRREGRTIQYRDIEKNLERIFVSLFSDEGYAAVKVQVSRSGDPVVAPEAISVPFSIVIKEGRIYELGSIHMPPNSPDAQQEIDKLLGTYGKTAAKGVVLRYAWKLISSRYKSKGYLDCEISPHPEFDEASGTVSYTVDINPGPVTTWPS